MIGIILLILWGEFIMSKSKVLATLIALVSSTSLCLADGTCPSQSELNGNHIKELATTGKTTIGSKIYELVDQKKTGTDFNMKLLDTAKHLEGFVKVTGHTVSSLQKADARAVSIQKTPYVANKGFCAFSISIGTTNAVIALEESGGASVAPTRPAHPAPTSPSTAHHKPSDVPPPVPARTYSPPSEPPPLPPREPVPSAQSHDSEEEATGGGLLAEIRKRKELKHVEAPQQASPSPTATPSPTAKPGQGMSMMDELQMKMKARQKQTD